MRVGILSDTHNDELMTRQAVEIFRDRKVDLVVHAGDIGSNGIVRMFEGMNAAFVLGNCDTDHDDLRAGCVSAGFEPALRSASFNLEEKRFFVCHGDDCSRYREAVTSGSFDYLIIGHTHEFSACHKGNTLVINPGAVTRDDHSDVLQTVAILDVDTGHVERIVLSADAPSPR